MLKYIRCTISGVQRIRIKDKMHFRNEIQNQGIIKNRFILKNYRLSNLINFKKLRLILNNWEIRLINKLQNKMKRFSMNIYKILQKMIVKN
ncbi:unnamed protein product [Paramecium sonneborni]|uniref:Uncharacterized protein n=1 Tax=Paramecium sonneborni TaxID=65129 RepID=A0A8S1RM99_9CILI|nr:unnamed protein product [Paramecium sonneborni]